MRCPKCHYISFDDSDRCRNCGYEFSLTVDVAALDLPIQTGEEAIGALSDFALGDLDGMTPEAARAATFDIPPPTPAPIPRQDPVPEAAPPRRPIPSGVDLPLFEDRALDDDAPLVTRPAAPRAPLAVRRSSPAIARTPRTAVEEPELDLDPEPGADQEDIAPPAARRAEHADGIVAPPVADIGPRLFAGMLDVAILGAIDATVLYFTLEICGFSLSEVVLLPVVPLVAFLVLLNGGYFVAFTAAGGQTIGKMAAGIKVVPTGVETSRSDRVGLGTSFVRAAAYLVSVAPAGAGLLPALLTTDRRAVHDRLAHTRVVKA